MSLDEATVAVPTSTGATPWEDEPAEALPTVLDGRYVLGESIGRGGMAEVYRARDTVLGRSVAVKLFHQHGALPDGDVRRAGEVRLVAALNHPGLVMLYDAGRDTSRPSDPFAYLVMELVEGTTLANAIADGPLEPARVADIGAQLAGALAYVHSRGVVHRDIKPANVLLSTSPSASGTGTSAKLADFGVARLVDGNRLTVHGTTLGTPNYLSPEQTTGEPTTPAGDVYSFGLVLLEALTGQKAYPGFGVEAAVQRLHHQPAIPSWIRSDWRDLLTRMTAFDPQSRPSAAAVEACLRAMADGTAPTTLLAALGPLHSVPPVHPGRSAAAQVDEVSAAIRAQAGPRRRRVLLAGLAAAAIALGAVLWGVIGAGSSQPAVAAYPTVAGPTGAHLAMLQDLAPQALHDDVITVTQDVAAGHPRTALRDLATLRTDLVALHDAGRVSDLRFRELEAATAVVATDLRHLLAASRGAATPTAAPSPTRSVKVARPQPQLVRQRGTATRTSTAPRPKATTSRSATRTPPPAPAKPKPAPAGKAPKPAKDKPGKGKKGPAAKGPGKRH